MPTDDEFEAAKRHGVELLSGLPGVHLVGGGSKEVDGVLTGEPAIKVYVVRKLPLEEIPAANRVPETIDGVRTDVVQTGEIHLVAAPQPPPGANRPGDMDSGDIWRHRPLIGGSQLEVFRSNFEGTLGCFVWQVDPATQQPDLTKIYALTCYHVLSPPDARAPVKDTTEVGQPETGGFSGCCQGTFGRYASAGGRVTAPQHHADRDEALVRLDPGMQWKADILGIGADGTDTSGADGAVQGTDSVSSAQAYSGTYRVRKRGKLTELTGGILGGLVPGASLPNNVLVVNPNAAPGPGTSFFCWEKDSGSALVNDGNKVVGLLYARDDEGHGYALVIDDVLARLAKDLGGVTLKVATAQNPGIINTVPGAAMAVVPREVVSALTPASTATSDPPVPVLAPAGQWALPEPPPPSFGHVEKDLDRSASGRRLAAMWREHQAELSRLVNTNRRLAATWHRSGAAAIFQLLARMTMDPAVRMPDTVNGQPLALCADRVHAILARSASPLLRTDLDWIRGWLPDIAGLTYPQILQTLDRT